MPSLFDRSFEIAGGGRLSSTRTLRFSDSSLARLRWESSAPLRPRIRLDGVDVADTDGVIRPSSSSILSIEVRGPAGTRLRVWIERDPEGPPLLRVRLPASGFFEENTPMIVVEADAPLSGATLDGRPLDFGSSTFAVLPRLALRRRNTPVRLGVAGVEYRNQLRLQRQVPVRRLSLSAAPRVDQRYLRLAGTGLNGATLLVPGASPLRLGRSTRLLIPPGARSGTWLLQDGNEQESFTINLPIPPLSDALDRPARELLRPVGPPASTAAYGEEELRLRGEFPSDISGEQLQDWLQRAGARVVGVQASESPEDPLFLWLALPASAGEQVEEAASRGARFVEEGVPEASEPETTSVPTDLSGATPWYWGHSDGPGRPARPLRPDEYLAQRRTWHYELARLPAIWNLKRRAVSRADVLVVDSSSAAGHPDLVVQGAFAPGAKPHAIMVSSVIGATHNGSRGAMAIDGVNPLFDPANPGITPAIIAGPGIPTGKAGWIQVKDAIKNNRDVRVVNCSFGLDVSKRTNVASYFHLPKCTTALKVGNPFLRSQVAESVEPLVSRVFQMIQIVQGGSTGAAFLGPAPTVPAVTQRLMAYLAGSVRGVMPPRTEAELFEVVRRAIADGGATVATTGGATWAKVAAALAGSVSTDPDGIVPAMPESTTFFPRYFEGRLLPEFASTGVEAELQSRGALLVKSAGNNGVLAPPPGGLTLDPLWVGWLPGQSLDYRFGEAPAYRYHSGSSTNLLVVGGLMPTASGVDLWAEAPSGSLAEGAIRGQGSCVGQDLLYIAAQQVPVLTPNGSYVYGAGTSFAAPFVSGVAAYLLALDPENPQGKDREAQIARLKAALMDGAASIGGRKVLDAYASARRFLTDPATPKRIRGFDRLMCDCDDGTRHGNDRPAASGPDGSGSSPEWLEGDGRINMAELRAFRDAWLQCHVVFPRLTAAKPVEQTGAYALRLRDLAASGATPWDSTWDESDDTKKKSSYLLWNRFDFDGDGAIAREQPVESATLARLRSDPTLPMVAPGTGLELALLASLWPESLSEAGAELPWKMGKVYPSDYEFVPDPTRLPELLPSCDLRITAAALKQLTDALAKENAVLESVSFQWSRGEWDPAAKSFTATNMDLPPHRREANAADFGRWMDQPPGLLTLPLVELPKLSSFVPPDSTKNQCYQFILTVLASGKGAGSYPFEAIVDAPRAIGGEGDKHGCIAALLGGRYSITGFSLDPNKKPKPPAAPEQPKATAEVGVTKGSGLQIATIGTQICVDCMAQTVQVPTPPLGAYVPVLGGGVPNPLYPTGGGGGGGGIGGFPGWNGQGGGAAVWGSPPGPVLCYATINSLIQYFDSNFKVTVRVVPPDGARIASATARMRPGPGLTPAGAATSAAGGAGASALSSSSNQVDSSLVALLGEGVSPDEGEQEGAEQVFRFVLRGEEGLRRYSVAFAGTLEDRQSGQNYSFGPMEVQGQIEVVPPFFLVALSFPSPYLEAGEKFAMIAALTNAPSATETAFDVVMSVSANNAEPSGVNRRELGDIAPGDCAVADFEFVSALTGPVTGTSIRTGGRVSATATVGGVASAPPSFPLQGTAGLRALLARYPELCRALIALVGAAYAEGLLRSDMQEMEAAIGIGYALHRAGFRLLDGEPDLLVLGALVRDAQGEAAAHEAVDLLRRSGPVAERLRRAVGPALVQAGATEDRQALIEALMRCQGGEPAVLVAGSGTLILADDQDRSVGGPAGFQLPHADAYTLPTMELRVAVLPSGRGRLEIVTGEGILVVSLPGRGGNILRCYRRISPGTRATLFYDENGAGDLRENGRRILPDMVAVEPDAGPGISTAVLAPDTGYGVGFRNIEVRFTEALDRNTALDRRNYQVAGYTVLRVSMYPPTRAVFLFMDNPVLDGAVLEVKDVRDRRGNPALLQRVPIRGGTYAGEVVGIARDPAGRPLPDARIQVEGDSFYRETRADEAGAFLVPFVPMGRSTVRITDSLRGRQVDVPVELVDQGQRYTVDARVVGDGVVSGRLSDAAGRPLGGAIVNLFARWPFETGNYTDADGFFRFLNVPLGEVRVVALAGELVAAATVHLPEADAVAIVDLVLRMPEVSVSPLRGSLRSPSGQPVPGAEIRAIAGTFAGQTRAGADGSFRFEAVPEGPVEVEARDDTGRRKLWVLAPTEDRQAVDLRFDPQGVVLVEVAEPDGRPAVGAQVGVGREILYADALGRVRAVGVGIGPVVVQAQRGENYAAESTVVADGQQSLVGIRLVPRAFPLPARLSDANGLRWELSPGGRLAVAGCALFDMQVDGQSFPGMEEGFPVTDGVEVGTESRRDGLHFGRRVYVSARDGFFARIVDSLRNEGPERRRVAPRWLQDRDAENIGGDRSFLSASHGCVGLLSPGLELGPRSVQAPELWLEPGATAHWIQFAVFRPQPADVGDALALLSGFPEVALVALSRREEISNLGPSTTSSPLLATSGVELQAVLPEGPVLPAGRLQLRVHSALFDREITAILDPTGGARILPLPVGQLQVVVEHPATGARGRAEATLEPDRLCRLTVVLGDCGTVEGTVVDGQGLPVPGCDVFVQGTRTATTLGGGFRQRGIPLGRKTVEVQERQTGLRARTEVELTEVGQTVRTSLALPPVGSLSGRVLDAEGAPVPEALISLRVIDPLNGESRSLRADVSGRYDIATVRAGPAQVIATHPRTGAVGLVEVEVLPYVQVQCDLSLGVVGVVTVRALDGQGLPVPGARVRVQDGPLQRDGIADGAGRFTVVGVDAGSLSVEARGPDGVGLGITTARLEENGQRLALDVVIDTVAPILHLDAPPSDFDSARIQVAADDGGLGVAELKLLLNDRLQEIRDGVVQPTVTTGLRLGYNRLLLSARDRAGNESQREGSLHVRAGRLRLQVVDEEGRPLESVSLFQQDRRGPQYRTVSGSYEELFPAGELYVFLLHAPETPERRVATLRCLVSDGEDREEVVVLRPYGAAALRVVSREGGAAAGAVLSLSGPVQVEGVADGSGSWFQDYLPPGRYTVEARFRGDQQRSDVQVVAGTTAALLLSPAGYSTLIAELRGFTQPVLSLRVDEVPREVPLQNSGFVVTGLLPGSFYEIVLQEGTRSLSSSGRALPPPDTTFLRLQLPLLQNGVVRGVVQQADGSPAPGLRLRVAGLSVLTDADGSFRVEGLAPGEVELRATGAGGETAAALAVVDGPPVLLQLPPPGSLRIEVVGGDGNPAANIEIQVVRGYYDPPLSAVTDAEGVVVLQVAGTAYFRVEAYDPRTQQRRTEYLSLEPGAERLLALVFPPCGRVEGRILNHLGDPVGGIPIRLYGADSFGEATSAADGSFGFDGVRAGEGTIVLEVSQVLRAGFSGTQRLRAREERARPAAHGERVAVDVVLDLAAELRGRLLPPGPEGYLILRCSHPVYGTSFGAYVQADGFYRFTGVPSGPYRLLFAQAERGLLAVAEGEITTDDQPVIVDLPLRPGATLPLSRSSYDGRTWTLSTDLSLDGSLGLEAPVQVEIADLDGEEIVAGPRRVLVGSWVVRVLDRLEEAGALVLSELDYGELIEEDPAWVLCRVGDRWEVILWSAGVAQPLQRREGSRLLSPAGQRLVLRGSYADEATARVALARMQARPPEVLQGLAGPILDWELEGSQAEALPPFRDRFFRLQPRGRDGVIPLPLYSLQLQSGLPLFRAPKSLYVGSSGDVQVGPVQLPDGPVELVGLSYVLGEEAESRVQRVLGEEAEVEVLLPFAKGESIVGQVVGADGSGQPYASVQVGYQSFTADDQGYFRVGPVGAGIEILSSGGAEDFVALPGAELRLVVPPTETTVVEVVDPDGRPVPGIEVEFFAVHRPVAVAFSDSDGRAQVEGPAGLRARVRLPSTGQAVVGSGRLSLPGRARIEGRVQEADGSPASFVDVEVQPALSEAPVGLAADGVQAGGRSYYLRTGPDGSFTLEESPLGALRVRATAADGRQVEGQSEGGQVALLFPSPGLRTVRVEVEAPGRRCLQVAADGGEPVPVEEGVAMLQLARGQLQVRLRLDFEGEGSLTQVLPVEDRLRIVRRPPAAGVEGAPGLVYGQVLRDGRPWGPAELYTLDGRRLRSSDQGRFLIPQLPPGEVVVVLQENDRVLGSAGGVLEPGGRLRLDVEAGVVAVPVPPPEPAPVYEN